MDRYRLHQDWQRPASLSAHQSIPENAQVDGHARLRTNTDATGRDRGGHDPDRKTGQIITRAGYCNHPQSAEVRAGKQSNRQEPENHEETQA